MRFSDFSKKLELIESISARLEMTQQLADLYRQLAPEELRQASYLLQGSLVPSYKSLEFQLSVKMVLRSLSRLEDRLKDKETDDDDSAQTDLFGNENTSDSTDDLTREYKKFGDIGLLAEALRARLGQEQENGLMILQVFEALREIALASGQGSQEKKVVLVVNLLEKLDPISCKFVCRIIVGKMRLGFSTMTLLDALSWSRVGNKSHRQILEDAYQKRADVGELAEFYLSLEFEPGTTPEEVKKKFADYRIEVGVPVVPALCQRLNSALEIIEKMGAVFAEPKYDGLRVQIHHKVDESGQSQISCYTRNLEEVTHQFPELERLPETVGQKNFIIDAEAIGYDPETGALLPFQQTITRKRKHQIDEVASNVPIRFYVFDVLKMDKEELINKPLRERKALLSSLIKENESFLVTTYIETSDPKQLRDYHHSLLAEGLEGAVIKQVDERYQSGRKGWSWVKIKESEGSSGMLSDTIDAVVMGYYFGRGKRADFGMGAFLAGIIDDSESGELSSPRILTIAKIGTGLTDDQIKNIKKMADDLKILEKPNQYHVEKSLTPDIWIEPEIVVEIAADEITKSPVHTAGVALRFPRLIRLRTDKKWEDATSLGEVEGIKIG